MFCIAATAIKEQVAGAEVIFNLVPKVHAMADIYCQLIPNEDDNILTYEIVPRIGSFEVSVNGVLLFSKMMSGCWPHATALADRAFKVAEAIDKGQDISQFHTSGAVQKQRRGGKAAVQNQAPAQ
jgi:predicted Rdx family selenoprotein